MSQIPSDVVIATDEPEKLLEDKSEEIYSEASEDELEYPDGGLDAWLAVLGSFLICFAPLGLMNSFGTFQVRLPVLPEVVY